MLAYASGPDSSAHALLNHGSITLHVWHRTLFLVSMQLNGQQCSGKRHITTGQRSCGVSHTIGCIRVVQTPTYMTAGTILLSFTLREHGADVNVAMAYGVTINQPYCYHTLSGVPCRA